jgi:hypothetical protein
VRDDFRQLVEQFQSPELSKLQQRELLEATGRYLTFNV